VAACAAREVSALSTAVLLMGGQLGPSPTTPSDLEIRIRAELTEAGPAALDRMVDRAHRYGAGYTLGEAGHLPTADYRPLTRAGVCTLVAVPVGPPEVGGVLLVADERALRPDPTTVSLMELLAGQAWTSVDRLRTLARLREQASSDPLTGLRHTGPFGQRIATATPGRTALLAIDVDGFKTVNDTYGHQAGDRVLVGLARALEGALRHGDELYRIGGDEFVAVIEVSRPEEAVRIAERLTEAARRVGRTISVGVALPRPGETPDRTLRRADQALYAVKRQGRDGVRLSAA
jgi:diguanylate cyclase (GGDEF)-like protein